VRVSASVVCALALIAADDAAAQTLPASYPEGPLWQGERLFYAEMDADRVSVYERGARRTFFSQRGCGPTAIAPYADGFVVLCHRGARVVAIDAEGRETRRWTHDAHGQALRDPNDASADARGGVYLTDPGRFDADAGAEGYVLYLSAAGVLTRVAGPLHYPNGAHVAGDALYVSEHLRRRVLRFPIGADGTLGEASVFADLAALPAPSRFAAPYPLRGPDGLEIGPDGDLYVAIYGDGRVLRFSPAGALVGERQVAPRYVTNVAFGAGRMAVTGAFENRRRPYRGEVRIAPAGR
jgi:sugar lactone lactonase YvrE